MTAKSSFSSSSLTLENLSDCWCPKYVLGEGTFITSSLQVSSCDSGAIKASCNDLNYSFILVILFCLYHFLRSVLSFRMDCLIKTVKTEGYFGMYRGKIYSTPDLLQWLSAHHLTYLTLSWLKFRLKFLDVGHYQCLCRRSGESYPGHSWKGHQTRC